MTESRSLEMAGSRPSSDQLIRGLPIFYEQLLEVLAREQKKPLKPAKNSEGIRTAANQNDKPVKHGSVEAGGSTGRIMEDGLNRMQTLIDKSLTEVRLRVDPKVNVERIFILQLVNEINTTTETYLKNQTIDVSIDPSLCVQADHHLLYSALSNLIQNALKYSADNATIQIRGATIDKSIVIEIEDACGGLKDSATELFKPFEQKNENKKGLGLGLTIAQKAVLLNKGQIEVKNIPGKGCIFKISLPSC